MVVLDTYLNIRWYELPNLDPTMSACSLSVSSVRVSSTRWSWASVFYIQHLFIYIFCTMYALLIIFQPLVVDFWLLTVCKNLEIREKRVTKLTSDYGLWLLTTRECHMDFMSSLDCCKQITNSYKLSIVSQNVCVFSCRLFTYMYFRVLLVFKGRGDEF